MKSYRCDNCNQTTLDSLLRERQSAKWNGQKEWWCSVCACPWYVLSVEDGHEHRVAKAVTRQVMIDDLEDVFVQAFVPTHRVRHRQKDGKVVERSEVTFVGYILIRMEFTEDLYHLLRGVKGTFTLLPSYDTPTPLRSKDAARLLIKPKEVEIKPAEPVKLPYAVGDEVTVKDGPFKGAGGRVLEIDFRDPTDPTVKVGVFIFGRETPVPVKHDQVKP